MHETLRGWLGRLFLGISFLMALLAAWEKLANVLGYTVLRGTVTPARLLEWTVVALLFAAVLQLRQIAVRLESGPPR